MRSDEPYRKRCRSPMPTLLRRMLQGSSRPSNRYVEPHDPTPASTLTRRAFCVCSLSHTSKPGSRSAHPRAAPSSIARPRKLYSLTLRK